LPKLKTDKMKGACGAIYHCRDEITQLMLVLFNYSP